MSSLRTERRCVAALVLALPGIVSAADVAPQVRAALSTQGSADVLLVFADQSTPSLAPLVPGGDYRVRRRALVSVLRARADASQTGVRTWLDAHGIAHRDFWIANAVQTRITASELAALERRKDIVRIDPNPLIANALPQPELGPQMHNLAATGIAWGVSKIDAPAVWARGDTGQGVVIGGEDTGYQWDHPALQGKYRGWNGTSANHNYNWHDAIHDSTDNNPCGNDSPVPCDDVTLGSGNSEGHGTHTMGTMTGDDGAGNQIGVAPGAKWIGCRNMDEGNGTPARYIECMQWMLAPTDLNGQSPNPDLAPDIVSNSWYCAVSEGCTVGDEIEGAVDHLVAAGIFYVAAAGNNGSSGCGSVAGPPAIYDASFVVGATNSSDALASFSSRGPVNADPMIRPDLVAPGVNVNSSIPGNSYTTMAGTSMATPHVAGAAALLISAFPALKGKPGEVASILRETAVRSGVTDPVTQSCGGIASTVWPNYALGYGRVDALAAYSDVIFIDGFDR